MSQDHETLSGLVAERAGRRGSGLPTFEELAARSVDPKTGYQPSGNLLWKIARGQDVKVNEALIGAIAAGLGLPLQRVGAAAAFQYMGYVATGVAGGVVLHKPSVVVDESGANTPLARAVLERWQVEEGGGKSSPGEESGSS